MQYLPSDRSRIFPENPISPAQRCETEPMTFWRQNGSLTVEGKKLVFDGAAVEDLVRRYGTPLYIYSREAIRRRLGRLKRALSDITDRYKIYYAMKANRFPGVLQTVREISGVGMDVCSPREAMTALELGFPADSLSFNSSMLSDRDMEQVSELSVYCTLDSYSALKRYGNIVPRHTKIGLRFNPGVQVGYSEDFGYAGDKFGFEPEELPEALRIAKLSGLTVDSVHMHVGWGLPESASPLLENAFERLARIAAQIPDLRAVNVGGGLGGRFARTDRPLSTDSWSHLIRRHLAPIGAEIACEPGTYVVRSAGILAVEVNTVEKRRGISWIGVNAGFPINPLPAVYHIPLEVVPVSDPLAPPAENYRIVGHMNDVSDVWAHQRALPVIHEKDILAFLSAGAYCSAMSSDHCLRGQPAEIMI